MNKPIQPTFGALILIVLAVLCVSILPVSIQIVPRSVEAQTTPAASDAQTDTVDVVAQATQIVEYTLRTVIGQNPPMAFVGVGGSIDGQINPTLTANVGDTVRLTVVNGDPVLHDWTLEILNVTTGQLLEDEQSVTLEFTPTEPGEFTYLCSIPGHRDIGMHGILQVTGTAVVSDQAAEAVPVVAQAEPTVQPAASDAVSIVRDPADVPPPVGDRGPMTLRVDLTTEEVTGVLADGTTFNYFTFDGKVPGPMLRVRVGDTVDFVLHNATDSLFPQGPGHQR